MDVVHDGVAGLDMASVESYDVIVMDLMLPKMSGMAVCKQLREDKAHTPILMLTAKGQLEDRVEGLDAGADDYLVKPFAFVEFLARVRALSRRNADQRELVLSCGELRLHTVTHEVSLAGKTLILSQKEFALLEFLMRRKNSVVTKEQILENVWGYDAEVLPNSVEVYIRHLRSKIDTEERSPMIHTIRGFGYSLRGA